MKKITWIIRLFLMIGVSSLLAGSEQVVRISDESQPLEKRWTQAFQSKNDLKESCWIGYGIEVIMEDHFNIYNGYDDSGDLTLEELLSGQRDISDVSVQNAARAAFESRSSDPGRKSKRRLGILFKFQKNTRRVQDCAEIRITDFDSPLDLDGRPLVWMGNVSQDESLPFLIDIYKSVAQQDQKEDLVSAVAFHRQQKETVPFLKKIVLSREEDDVRKQAVFWLSQQEEDVLDFLVDIAHTDRSEDVREHAVFAISQVEGKAAEEALITLAKKDKDPEIRKKAVFWLGQNASDKTTQLLKDVVKDDPDTDVKEHAVFALSQMQTAESSKLLMEIAKTNPSLEVRKKAIFWLGQSGDPEAVDFLVDLVRQIE